MMQEQQQQQQQQRHHHVVTAQGHGQALLPTQSFRAIRRAAAVAGNNAFPLSSSPMMLPVFRREEIKILMSSEWKKDVKNESLIQNSRMMLRVVSTRCFPVLSSKTTPATTTAIPKSPHTHKHKIKHKR
mmetsp:Transcript_31943/g.35791  ORF Transcript_31943/g.35791 Transcript_31943/m.35791 type:complete len:129 (+) Transcript_31943:209-595(+)